MQKTMIPVRNWTILEERVGFLQLQSNFNQVGGLYNENDNDKYIKITLPPFDPTNETYDLFLELQNEVVEKEIAHRFAFTFIVNAAEYYMIPCLQKYIKPKFFGSSLQSQPNQFYGCRNTNISFKTTLSTVTSNMPQKNSIQKQ
jgi:hypothetical protein